MLKIQKSIGSDISFVTSIGTYCHRILITRSAIQQCDLFPYFHVVYMQAIISVLSNLSLALLSVKRGR